MKKVLVTGSGGFVGRHLVDLLKTDYEVIGTLFGEDLKDQENVSYHEGNIQDPKFLEDLINKYSPDFIVHLAARAISWDSDTEQIFNTNFLGTINLYKAVIANRNKNPDYNPKILYVSSAEIYGKTTAPDKINEHCPFFPVNFYAVSKVAGDRLSYQLSQSEKLNILIARPFNHTGPGQQKGFFVPDMASQIVEIENDPNGQSLKVGNLESIRDLSDVRDIVRAYKMLLEAETTPGEAVNVCSGKGQKMKDVLEKLLSFAKKEIKVEEDPERFYPVDIKLAVGDNSKLKSLTGWEPQIPLDQTLEDALDYWRDKP
ncbi:hypothetical protein A3E66_05495 [Candidatus Daviesbacteria bacterium RIFCSPHIGHO2_12_FULL_37_16]|uniref:NAD-dependent epimerase/dehydratase n=3 Tax=Candidatus Daviesiibacteriota TaxID=1752718 RepID=A0A0G0HWR2_9BACT|nr:MAG: NAD-dependent epimerase/dehydratase [Candidatus Daviesbacteria bacterium GW2011_GWB1_36_5]KKQ15182.1 MAG: NAD-dependent epimerase/dehydratase [Candidatus Daviesbacteria bacterium GW2011_GWA1_36_8]OGE36229.1 MAG: hypothetical protein A3E66_05495 [Candidatus Daviesbacteria bacterium RIFCSPHIGHO2_12_FULL_37_16]